MTLTRLRRWWAGYKVERFWRKHAEWTGKSIACIAETNPTLATVTWTQARAVMRDENRNQQERLGDAITLVQEALAQEYKRLEYGELR